MFGKKSRPIHCVGCGRVIGETNRDRPPEWRCGFCKAAAIQSSEVEAEFRRRVRAARVGEPLSPPVGMTLARAAEIVGQERPQSPAESPEADVKAAIAEEAVRIVNGSRRGDYGTPEDNFNRIANFWTAYFQNTGRDVKITAQDVSPMMRLMKEARLCDNPGHYDSHVDLVGYALTGAEVMGLKIPLDRTK